MSSLLNKIFIDSFSYFDSKNLTISEALKMTDILMLNIKVNSSNSEEFISYLDNIIELNKLLSNYFTNLTDKELELFDNDRYEKVKNLDNNHKEKALNNIKERRLQLYNKYNIDLVNKINVYKNDFKVA